MRAGRRCGAGEMRDAGVILARALNIADVVQCAVFLADLDDDATINSIYGAAILVGCVGPPFEAGSMKPLEGASEVA